MGRKRLALVRPAQHQPHDILRHARLMVETHQHLSHRWRLFGRFEQHTVPGQQGRDDMAIGQMGGEIIGA